MREDRSLRYFEFIGRLGMTKHYGSIDATRELAEACGITRDSYVLDVGCGVGATPALLAKEIGCRVVGVDVVESMLEQTRERAKAAGVKSLVDARLGDARNLPFEDDTFDAVLTESVLIFFPEKLEALREFARVCKPAGVVGISEMIWLVPDPPAKMVEMYKELIYAESLDAEGYVHLMKEAGYSHVVAYPHRMDVRAEGRGRIERYGCLGTLGILLRMLKLFVTDRDAWMFIKGGVGGVSDDMFDVMGYGLFTGRKP